MAVSRSDRMHAGVPQEIRQVLHELQVHDPERAQEFAARLESVPLEFWRAWGSATRPDREAFIREVLLPAEAPPREMPRKVPWWVHIPGLGLLGSILYPRAVYGIESGARSSGLVGVYRALEAKSRAAQMRGMHRQLAAAKSAAARRGAARASARKPAVPGANPRARRLLGRRRAA